MVINIEQTIPTTTLLSDLYADPTKDIRVEMLRLDMVHPTISGNKWFKLKENLAFAKSIGRKQILTFGGAYSNHLVATAAAANAFQVDCIGYIRGIVDQPSNESKTLLACRDLGMHLHFVSREEYAQKANKHYLLALQNLYPEAYIIPEGGNNELGIKGASEIAAYLPSDTTHCAVAIGTGTTFCGIASGLQNKHIKLLGFTAMKGGSYLKEEIATLLPQNIQWELYADYHFGGFGKCTSTLIEFMNHIYSTCQLPLDFVYTAKMLLGVIDLINKNYFPPESKICCIHTGGLQGNNSIAEKLIF